LKDAEIAEVPGINLQVDKMRIRRGRASLKTKLSPACGAFTEMKGTNPGRVAEKLTQALKERGKEYG
jgi:hypothetical protein